MRAIGSDLHMDYTAVGQTTHLAARMEQLADPGSTLLTAETLALAEGFLQVTSLGPMAVKGLPGPVDVYELTGISAVRSRLQAAAARGLSPFVGRDAEIEQLRRAVDQARQGRGQVAAIVGEPGVGKSRLTFELTHSPRVEGWLVLEAGASSHGKATSYLPVSTLLRSYFKLGERDTYEDMRASISARLSALGESLWPAAACLRGAPRCARRGRAVARARASPAPPAHARSPQAPDPPREPGPAAAPRPRGSALDRCRDPGVARRPGRRAPRRSSPAPRHLSPRVPARLGQPDLLHAAPRRSAPARRGRGSPADARGRRRRAGLAADTAHPADGWQPVLSRRERADPRGDEGPGG